MRAAIFIAGIALLSGLAVVSCGGASSGSGGDGGGGAGGSTTSVGAHGCANIQGSCTSNGGVSCEESAGFDAASLARFKAGCNHPNQVWSDGPCVRTGTVGGCGTDVGGVCGVIWSFAPITAAEVQMGCVGQYQMLVTP